VRHRQRGDPGGARGRAGHGAGPDSKAPRGGRAKAEAAGVEAEWVEGDAEELPFEDGSFDRVRRVAEEMARVCREGGAIVTATWTPEGITGRTFAASAAYMPPPPDYASPPILWGTEEHVRELFGAAAKDFRFERHVNRIEWDSIEGWAEYFLDRFGPLVTAREMLGERFGGLRGEILAIWRDANEADNGSLVLPQEYLLSNVRV
jgi:SAM-dependent methyltransferase